MSVVHRRSKTRIGKCPVRAGMSMIGVMVFAAVISIAIIGTSAYRYFSSIEIRKSALGMTAGNVAQLLCESWRGVRGDQNYDPTADSGLGLTIASHSTGPEPPPGFAVLRNEKYEVVSQNHSFYVTMSYYDIDNGLRALNVKTAWSQRDGSGDNLVITDKTLSLTSSVIRWLEFHTGGS